MFRLQVVDAVHPTMAGQHGYIAVGAGYGTFRLNFHRFDRFELDLRGYTKP